MQARSSLGTILSLNSQGIENTPIQGAASNSLKDGELATSSCLLHDEYGFTPTPFYPDPLCTEIVLDGSTYFSRESKEEV